MTVVSTRQITTARRAYRVYIGSKPTPLMILFNNAEHEWDLVTDTDYILSASSRRQVIANLQTLITAIGVSES